MKIPFDIKYRSQIESGEYKVETRDGRPVRIICWDKVGNNPIVALIPHLLTNRDWESILFYTAHGRTSYEVDCDADLFIITPEPELSEFEKQIENLLNLALPEGHAGTTIKDTKRVSAELLAIARKEIEKELPRWRRWGNGACGNGQGIPIAIVKQGLNGYKLVDALGISGEQYIMLSDLEKLPKEDEK